MGEPPLRTAEGHRLLCALNINTRNFRHAPINPSQVHAVWPELASASKPLRLFVGLQGLHELQDVTAHSTIASGGRSFYLSLPRTMRKGLGPGLVSTSILSLAQTARGETLGQLDTAEGRRLLASFASPTAPSRTRSRLQGEGTQVGAGEDGAAASTAAAAGARGTEGPPRRGKKRKDKEAVAAEESGDGPERQMLPAAGEAAEFGTASKRSRKRGRSASRSAEANAALGQPAGETAAVPQAAADAAQSSEAARKAGRPKKGKGKHAAAAGAPGKPAADKAAGAKRLAGEEAAVEAAAGRSRRREGGPRQLLAAQPPATEAEVDPEWPAVQRRSRRLSAHAALQSAAVPAAAGMDALDPAAAEQALDSAPRQESPQRIADAQAGPTEGAALQAKPASKRGGKQPGRRRQPAAPLAAETHEPALPENAAAAAPAAASCEAGARDEGHVAAGQPAAQAGLGVAVQGAPEAASTAVAAPPAGAKSRGREPLAEKQPRQVPGEQGQQKGRQRGRGRRRVAAGPAGEELLHEGQQEGSPAPPAAPGQEPADQSRGLEPASARADQQQQGQQRQQQQSQQQQQQQQHRRRWQQRPGAASRRAAAPAAPAAAGGLYTDSEEDEVEAFYREQRELEQLRRHMVTGNRQGPRSPPAPAVPAVAAAAPPALAAGKRERKVTWKVAENEETDALLMWQQAREAEQRAQQTAQHARHVAQRVPLAAGPRGHRTLRRGGMTGVAGFAASSSKGSAHQPMALLPGEEPLGVELFFGEGRPLRADGRAGPPSAADVCGEGKGLPVAERYAAAVRRARQRLSDRMRRQGSSEEEVEAMLRLLREFEAKCLAGSEPVTPEEGQRICTTLDRRLRQVYNRPGQPPLVLDPHVLSSRPLEEQECAEDVQLMRVMERRFIIWTPPELPAEHLHRVAGAGGVNAAAVAPVAASDAVRERACKGDGQGGGAAAQPAGGSQQAEGGAGGGGAGAGSAWDRGLAGIWQDFRGRLQGKKYGDIGLNSVENNVSCALNDTEWRDGHLKRVKAREATSVLGQIDKCREGKRPGRLYVTDGSMPDYAGQGYPLDAPGMACGVDSAANALLPHAVRSSRATSLFHALKNESTGTKTFTLFGPAGGGTNLTAFHFETKRRRSYNLGSGDFIIQPLATQNAMRKLMRIHAAVAGRHARHGQLLPLEVYLEEGLPLVLHVRDYPFATLCELCEQSMHAFVSFGTVACSPPCLKVSCNDCDLLWELDSCYWLEKLATAYKELHLLPEEALPPDGADFWVMSSYMLRRPQTLAQKEGGWERPWLCEAQGANLAAAAAVDLEEEDLHWSADVMAVRCVEKMLDVLAGALRDTAPWAGELPTRQEAAAVLRRALPVLQDMRKRAVSESSSHHDARGNFAPDWPIQCFFSREYIDDLLDTISTALAAEEAPQGPGSSTAVAAAGRRQNPLQAAGHGSSAGSSGAEAGAQVHAEYAAAASRRAPHVAAAADSLFALAAGEAAGSQQDGGASPALAALPPAALRSHWLLRLQLEWEALTRAPLDLGLLALRRRQRSEAEAQLDRACQQLAAQHRNDWTVLA